MSMAIGMINGGCGSSWIQHNSCLKKKETNNGRRRSETRKGFFVSSSLRNQYRTLRIQPGATETDVEKAFRKLALKYHCKENNNCGVQFNQINEAYNILLSNLRGEIPNAYVEPSSYTYSYATDNKKSNKEEVVYDEEEENYWEEWMGWEGAGIRNQESGIRDYSSHINPYIYHE